MWLATSMTQPQRRQLPVWLADHASPAANLTATFRLLGKFPVQGFDWATWILSGNFPAVAGELCGSIHYQRLPVHGVDMINIFGSRALR